MIFEKKLLVLGGTGGNGCLRLERTERGISCRLTGAIKKECVLAIRNNKDFFCFSNFDLSVAYTFTLPREFKTDSMLASVGDTEGNLLLYGGFLRPLPWRDAFESDIKRAIKTLGITKPSKRIEDYFLDIIPTDYDDSRVAEVNYYKSSLTTDDNGNSSLNADGGSADNTYFQDVDNSISDDIISSVGDVDDVDNSKTEVNKDNSVNEKSKVAEKATDKTVDSKREVAATVDAVNAYEQTTDEDLLCCESESVASEPRPIEESTKRMPETSNSLPTNEEEREQVGNKGSKEYKKNMENSDIAAPKTEKTAPKRSENQDDIEDIRKNKSLKDANKSLDDNSEEVYRPELLKNGKIPELKAVSFYESVKEQVEKLFQRNARFDKLEALLPDSKWIKVDYDNSGKFYLVGTIGEPVRYLCYGVPGEYSPKPPRDLAGYCQWLALEPDNPAGKGFWIMYQDAVTGKSVL